MTSTPRVSIGLPVYNGEKYLAGALDALLAQTFADFELIISDNCSTDRTEQICREYTDRDSRVAYERQAENRGACWNHNRVFELSRGEYFKWASYDDLHAPSFLERCVSVLDGHPQVTWCHPMSTHIDANGHRLEGPGLGDISYSAETIARQAVAAVRIAASREADRPAERFRAVLLGSHGNQDVFGLIRVSAMRKTGLMVPYYGMDKVFVAELSLGGRFQEIPELLFFNRVHVDGSGALRNASSQREFIAPKKKKAWGPARFKLQWSHVRSIMRAPMLAWERCQCLWILGEHMAQIKKWKRMLLMQFSGVGTGGGYLRVFDPKYSDGNVVVLVDAPPVTAESLIRGCVPETASST